MILKLITQNNESVEFSPQKFLPMSYNDLVCAIQGKNPLKFEGFADSFKITTNQNNSKSGCSFSFNINFNNPPSIFVLVEGGWLPLPFADPGIFIVDRNVISVLSKISEKKCRTDVQHTKWWLKFIQESSFIINPILYAFEGDKQRLPLFEEFVASFEDASIKIAKQFPYCNLIKYTPEKYLTVYKFLSDFADRTDREIKFLMNVQIHYLDTIDIKFFIIIAIINFFAEWERGYCCIQ